MDELRLITFPVLLGAGKRLFHKAVAPTSLRLVSHRTTGTGAIVATYAADGPVRTGSFSLL